MRFSTGFFDGLFGKQITIELPNGQKRTVTERWFAKMVRQGLIKPSTTQRQTIKVHTIGRSPEHKNIHDFDDWVFSGGKTYKEETWEIGKDVTAEQAAEYRDPSTGELYVSYQVVDNEWKGRFVSRELFLKIKAVYDL